MQKERDPLNLSSLPMVSPPSDGWPAIRAELAKEQSRRRLARYAGSALALAAAVVLTVGVLVRQPESVQAPATGPGLVQSQAPKTAPGQQTLGSLIALSQQLETRVRSIRSEFGGLPTDAVVYQVELEDLIVQVDEELSMNPESLQLWSHRVNLLLDLSRLYENQLRRDYHRLASL